MPKIWDNRELLKGTLRLNENEWFRWHQPFLLWYANTKEGRDVLCIDKSFPRIDEMAKNYVRHTWQEGKRVKHLTDFRVGAKWANVIRYRWEVVSEAMELFQTALMFPKYYRDILPRQEVAVFATTTTVYPDPDPETTTVDGTIASVNASATWASIRSGATSSSPSAASDDMCRISTSTTTDQFTQLNRGHFLFDTASIPDTDDISAATISFWVTNKFQDLATAQNHVLVASSSASNTDLSTADWTNYGSTKLATDLAVTAFTTNAYTDITLNSSGLTNISKTGVSKFANLMHSDFDNVAPTWGSEKFSRLVVSFAETAGTGNDPKLTVTHSAPATSFVQLTQLKIG